MASSWNIWGTAEFLPTCCLQEYKGICIDPFGVRFDSSPPAPTKEKQKNTIMGFYNEVYMTTSPLYTEEEIKNIVHVLDNAKQKFEEPEENKSFFRGEKKVKVSCVAWPEVKTNLKKFEDFIYDANNRIFKYDIVKITDDHFVNVNYYDTENPNYHWHMDGTKLDKRYDIKLTCILNISTEKYEGGNLVLYNIPDNINDIIKEKFSQPGYALLFTSNHFHKVESVTKGSRRSLSYWALGPLWR